MLLDGAWGDLFRVYFRALAHTHTLILRLNLPISNTSTHTSCLQTSNLVRFTFAGFGGWCQGVMSAECDLPCREHYYPREELNTGAAERRLNRNAERRWSKCTFKKRKEHTSAPIRVGSWRTSRPRAPRRTFPTSFLRRSFRSHFPTGPRWPPTQRAGQPAVITPCKCHLGLLIRLVLYRFN